MIVAVNAIPPKWDFVETIEYMPRRLVVSVGLIRRRQRHSWFLELDSIYERVLLTRKDKMILYNVIV